MEDGRWNTPSQIPYPISHLPSSMSKLAGKVAWISGATSGIGEATARLFAREGAKVSVPWPGAGVWRLN